MGMGKALWIHGWKDSVIEQFLIMVENVDVVKQSDGLGTPV
jgi:hypothetical protein